jgi:O-antigen/teichoic acid export membrane protein
MNSRKSTIVLLVQILSSAIGALTAIFIGRWLGPTSYGIYSYCYGVVGVFSGLGDLGFHQIYLKRIAEQKEEGRYTANFLGAKLVLVGMVVAGTLLALLWEASHGQMRSAVVTQTAAFILLGYVLTNLLIYPTTVYFEGRREIAKSSLVNIVQPPVMLVMVLLLLHRYPGPRMLALLALSQPISAALLIRFWLRRPVFIRPRFDIDVLRNYLSYVAPVALSSLAAGVYMYIDRLLIKSFLPYADVGYFVISQRFSVLLLLFSSSVMNILLAAMSRAHHEGRPDEVWGLARRATKYLSLITVPAAVFSALYAKTIITHTVGAAYLPAVLVMQVLMVKVIFMTYNRATSLMLNAIEKLKLISALSVGWYALGVSLDLVLIPKVLAGHAMLGLGVVGVAVKDVIVDLLALTLNNTLAYHYIGAKFYWRVLYHLIAGALFWGTSSWINRFIHLPLTQLVVGGAAGFVVYLGTLTSLGELGREELRVIWGAIDPQRARTYIIGELRVEEAAFKNVEQG